MNINEYLNMNPDAFSEVCRINKVFEPFQLRITEVIRCSQSIKYILLLPLNLDIQGRLKRNESNIRYTLSSALLTNEYNYGHESNYVYIERPATLNTVDFMEYSNCFFKNQLLLSLGVDGAGNKKVYDLSKAPHILVGGVTGSGKSELLHSFICSLILGMPYTQVQLYIIDPKRAEYSPYKNCKRISVITDMQCANNVLAGAVDTMEQRYSILERAGAKDIASYHGPESMHPIVIIIDELADLIHTYKSVEKNISRIAQKARACGIHLIIGTQSPRRDVVTGLIKANIPTRIALKTSNSIESRIIIERNGAERLLGKGDMLFMGNGAFEPIRFQSPYVTEQNKWMIASYIRKGIPA